MDREEYDTIKLGERVGFVFGPGEFPEHNQGTVTAKREDEWGFHAQVKMDNGSNSESVDGFTKKGIGCYRLENIYECEHCNAEFKESEILYRHYGGGVGIIAFCPRCKQATKLICVTGVDKQKTPDIEKIRALEGAIIDLVMAIQKGDTQLGDEIEAVDEATKNFPEWKIEVHTLAEGGT